LETAVGTSLLGCEQLKEQRLNQYHQSKHAAEKQLAVGILGQGKNHPFRRRNLKKIDNKHCCREA